jgi:YidC/Oxa1 family membrane protein insertase
VWPGVLVYAVLLSVIAVAATATRALSRRHNSPQPDATPKMQRVAPGLSWLPSIAPVFAAITPPAATIYLTVTTTW